VLGHQVVAGVDGHHGDHVLERAQVAERFGDHARVVHRQAQVGAARQLLGAVNHLPLEIFADRGTEVVEDLLHQQHDARGEADQRHRQHAQDQPAQALDADARPAGRGEGGGHARSLRARTTRSSDARAHPAHRSGTAAP
jgi:hypothetical protein